MIDGLVKSRHPGLPVRARRQAKAGVQISHKCLKTLDSGFCRNDGK